MSIPEDANIECPYQRVSMGYLKCRAADTTKGKDATNDVTEEICYVCEAGKIYRAAVSAADHENDSIIYRWDIMAESTDLGMGGDYESKPETWLTHENARDEMDFESPVTPGAYRLFVYVTDEGNRSATANIPFLVR